MKDWKAIAKASGLELPAAESERIVGPLDALEESLRPLLKDLPAELEPATGRCGEEEAE